MNFAVLLEMSKNYQGRIYVLLKELNDNDITSLKNEIETWDHTMVGLVKFNKLMKEFCNLDVPVKDFQNFLKDDLKIALEVYAERICETSNKDIAIDGFLLYLGIGSWPRHGESKEYRKVFHERLEKIARELGYWME